MHPVNEDDLGWAETDREEAHFRQKSLADAAGGEELGCSLYEVPPDGRSYPYHYHAAKAEAMYVFDGEGTLRLAGEEHAVESGDYVPFPADERGAHRLLNDAETTLRYLVFSREDHPDVRVYPDSGKVGVTAGTPGDGHYRLEDAVDYWEGE